MLQDPITGSAQCALAPYWAKKMGKCDLSVYAVLFSLHLMRFFFFLIFILNLWVNFKQASPRGGVVHVHFDDQSKRILMRGKAVTVMNGCVMI